MVRITPIPNWKGQWFGQSDGEPNGTIVFELEDVDEEIKGFAYLFPDETSILSSCITISFSKKLTDLEIDTQNVLHFDSNYGRVLSLDEIEKRYPDYEYPNTVKVKAQYDFDKPNEIQVYWESNVESYGKAILTRSLSDNKSNLSCEQNVKDWKAFQEHVTENMSDGFIYRGQAQPWPLQTAFHRTKRKDLRRYIDEDLPRLRRALAGRLKHVFDPNKPEENGAFFNLAQHHGFPTPLLDWTYSPFIAAYFAFSGALESNPDKTIRIFAFDTEKYTKSVKQYQTLTFTKPHFTIIEALSIENERAIHQQGLLSLTNLQDVEGFIALQEKLQNERFLYAFDLPSSEAEKALRDLRLMGITEATLFPSIDNICKEHKVRYF